MKSNHYKELPGTLIGPCDYSLLPMHMWGPMERYYWDGLAPGSFLTSCLCNQFVEASCRADNINSIMLASIGKFIQWHLPMACWGSPEKVASWIVKGGESGYQPGMAQTGPEDAVIEIAPPLDGD